jgi:hypothetical protein
MSRLLLIALLLPALLCAGCLGVGGGEDERPARGGAPAIDDGVSAEDRARPALSVADAEPTRAALAAKPGAALRAQLDAGAVALVDLVGEIGIRPRSITFATGGRLSELEWQRWDDRGAEGTGRLEGVVCDPDCARGKLISARASIRLSQPVACPAGRFFDRGEIEVASDDPDADSNSWLAAPC